MDMILVIVFFFLDESRLVLQHVTVTWATCHLDSAFCPVNFRVVALQPQEAQNKRVLSQVGHFCCDFLTMSLEFYNQLRRMRNASSRVTCSVHVVHRNGVSKGNKWDFVCVSAHVLSIKIVLAPESRSASVWVKFCRCVNSAIRIDKLISCAGLTLRT